MIGMHLAYLIARLSCGVPYTVDQAYAFVQNNNVAFGFPDILFESENPFAQLLEAQSPAKPTLYWGCFLPMILKSWIWSTATRWAVCEESSADRITHIYARPGVLPFGDPHLRISSTVTCWN